MYTYKLLPAMQRSLASWRCSLAAVWQGYWDQWDEIHGANTPLTKDVVKASGGMYAKQSKSGFRCRFHRGITAE